MVPQKMCHILLPHLYKANSISHYVYLNIVSNDMIFFPLWCIRKPCSNNGIINSFSTRFQQLLYSIGFCNNIIIINIYKNFF